MNFFLRNNVIEEETTFYATRKGGYWTRPYFDCGGGNVWMVSFSAQIFGKGNSGEAVLNANLTVCLR